MRMRCTSFAVVAFVAIHLSGADFEAGKAAFAKGDYETALKEWQPLAEQGLPFAAYNVALLYARGNGVKQDPAEAAKWYRIAAEKGIPEAQYNLGLLYSTGNGLPKDEMQAAEWFQKAAQKGDSNAANSIGTLYESSDGSLHDFAKAEKWYRQAAEQGNPDAAFNLGVMYDIGQGVKIDFKEAEKWYLKAAAHWEEGALCNLGILYYNGEGVERDLVQSHMYYLLAKEAGDPRASNLMELTTEKLTKKQIAKAQEQANEFKQQHAKAIELAKNPVVKPPSPDSVNAASSTAPVTLKTSASSGSGAGVWTGVDHVVAIGDIHGHYQEFTAALHQENLIDNEDNWSGGSAHLVQTGDVVDEGTDSRRIMDFLIKLENQAKAAGGMVHCLIGNHEAMDVYGDLRFVSPSDYQQYATADSEKLRERAFDQYQKEQTAFNERTKKMGGVLSKEEWMRMHPPGFVEQREAFAPEGKYGKWILSHDTVIRINGSLYSHAGVGSKFAEETIDQINNAVRDELVHPDKMAGGLVTDLQGPLWYQGFAQNATPDAGLDSILKKFEVARQVVGHVDAGGAVMPEFANRVILIDVRFSGHAKETARQACLLEQNGQLYALHRGSRVLLPKDDGKDMLRYLKQASALDPEPSPLSERIQSLETK